MDDEVIEGFYDGKALDRILKPQELEQIEREVGNAKSEANAKFSQTKRKIEDTQEKLKELNDQYYNTRVSLDKLLAGNKIELDAKEVRDVNETVKTVVKTFFAEKPEDEVQVHVHFHVAESESRQGMSTDATFTVPTHERFKALAVQVAKYWGLDAGEMFFLDRDGRVVPDEMMIADVVIPPEPAEFMISDWQYRVTVVRCKTELHVEDPQAVDAQMKDFTFSEQQLQNELDADRLEFGIKVSGMAGDDKLKIPSLLELKRLGEEKMRRMRFDVFCRTVEVIFFLIVVVLFHVQMKPNDPWLQNMQRIQLAIDDQLNVPFVSGVRTLNLTDIHEPAEFTDWVRGPLWEAMKDEGELQRNGLYPIGDILIRTYRIKAECIVPTLAPPVQKMPWYMENGSNATWPMNGSNTTGTDTCREWANDGFCDQPCGLGGLCDVGCSRGCACDYKTDCSDCMDCLSVNDTNRTTTTSTTTVDLDFLFEEEYCTCGKIAKSVFRDTPSAPKCVAPADQHIATLVASQWLKGEAFGVFDGKVSAYADGEKSYLPLNTTDIVNNEEWKAILVDEPLLQTDVRALRVLALVYAAAVEGLVAVSVGIESTAGGMIIPNVKTQIIDLNDMGSTDTINYGVLITCSLGIFLMEIRRWMCPENADEAEQPKLWWLVHLAVPIMISVSFYIRKMATGEAVGDLLYKLITARRHPEAMMTLFRYASYDSYWIITMIITLLLLNSLFFHYVLFYFKNLRVLTSTVARLFLLLLWTFIISGLIIACFAFILYSMFGSVSDQYRTPTRALLAAVSFAHGSFQEHATLMERYNGAWIGLMLVCWILLGLVMKNLAIGIFVSFGRDFMLRSNYQYHPFWAHQQPETFNPYWVKTPLKLK